MSRIYAAIFGSGLGHVTRSLAITEKLKEGNQFCFSSFDEGLEFLHQNGTSAFRAPSISLKWDEAGGVSGKDTFIRFPIAMSSFARQVLFEVEKISEFRPELVFSDSRLSSVFAAKSMSYPVVTVLNQLKILFPPRFRSGLYSAFLERIEGDILGLLWSPSDKILYPDLPPPFTIGEANLAHVDVAGKVIYTGFMTPAVNASPERLRKVSSVLQFDHRPLVFIQISGPKPTKSLFIELAIQSASELSKEFNIVISKGDPEGSHDPLKMANGGWLYEWCPIKDELFLISDALVTRAGHTTLSQCIIAGKPAVVVPIFNQSEQLWNAEKFAKLGLGIEIVPQEFSTEKLREALEICVQNDGLRSNVERIMRISEKYNGIERATDVIRSFL